MEAAMNNGATDSTDSCLTVSFVRAGVPSALCGYFEKRGWGRCGGGPPLRAGIFDALAEGADRSEGGDLPSYG
jgi:hypothetical protein